jgi:RTX calcium-binding nonapeptide repeat (4 copies)
MAIATNNDDTLIGTIIGDTINAKGGNDTVYAGAGDDMINAGDGNDTVYAGAGVDHLNGQQGDDTLYGEGGDDTLIGGPDNDTLYGGNDNDTLVGSEGNDTLVGGLGDDSLAGSSGTDTFKFSFNLDTENTKTFIFNTDGILTQSDLSTRYEQFLRAVANEFGTDTDGDGKISFSWWQDGSEPTIEGVSSDDINGDTETISVKTGNKFHDREIYTEITIGSEPTLTSADGHDTINGFNFKEDKLDFGLTGDNKLTIDQFEKFFKIEVNDYNSDGVCDTRLSLDDGSWSLTFTGVSDKAMSDFYSVIL